MTDNRTTELRRLLDERGVEHYDGAERTLWGYEPTGKDTGIYRFAASEVSGGFLQLDMFRVTPEQAIAATLGEVDDSGCYLVHEGKRYPAELDFGFLGLMPITITVGGFRYLVEVPNGEQLA